MPYKRKRGPKRSWQFRTTFLRAKSISLLKPNQVAELYAAKVFAGHAGNFLNVFATVRFANPLEAHNDFKSGMRKLTEWFRRAGGSLHALHIWEVKDTLHVHILLNAPLRAALLVKKAIHGAWSGHNVDVRKADSYCLDYLIKGTDPITFHRHASKAYKNYPSSQGIVTWKRCGTTQNLGAKARFAAGFM